MFSIIIPTYNNLDYLKLCLNSIKKNYRMSMMANAFTRIPEDRKKIIFSKAKEFIKNNSL